MSKYRGTPKNQQTPFGELMANAESHMAVVPSAPQQLARVFSSESISPADQNLIESYENQLEAVLTNALSTTGKKVVQSSESAGWTIGAELADNLSAVMARDVANWRSTKANYYVPGDDIEDAVGRRVHSIESFDNPANRQTVLFTAGFNYSIGKQSPFGELLWPTYMLGSDQLGFTIAARRFLIHQGTRHQTDGSITTLTKIDLARTFVDGDLLFRERTKLLPVVRANNASVLADPNLIPPTAVTTEGRDFKTAPYRVGQKFNIIGICQSDAQLQSQGQRDQTDQVDPAIRLEALYLTVGSGVDAQVVKFNAEGLFASNFVPNPQGQEHDRMLSITNGTLFLRPDTLALDGTDLGNGLQVIKTKKYVARVHFDLAGYHNSEYGTTSVDFLRLSLYSVTTEDGSTLTKTDADFVAIADALAEGGIQHFDLVAYLRNSNLREGGQFVDTSEFIQTWEVPLLSPISSLKPIGNVSSTSDVESLVSTCRARMDADAVKATIKHAQNVEAFYGGGNNRMDVTNPPEVLGACRFSVKPAFLGSTDPTQPISALTLVNSLNSAGRLEDIEAALIYWIREIAIQLAKKSEYRAGLQANGLASDVIDVLVACDYRIAPYILRSGDFRDLGNGFRMRLASTMLKDFDNRIYITFGQGFGDGGATNTPDRNATVNIFNHGNCVVCPEIVYNAPISRDGRLTQETIVQPRYRFVPHLPVCAMYTMTGFDKLVESLPIKTKEVI